MTNQQIKDFIRSKKNSIALDAARRQQRQLAYFTQSCIQEEITMEYLQQWADRKYANSDYFLNWIKMIFKTDNFLSFFKYLRHPLPSARIINDNVKLQLKRVFNAEDSYARYVIKGKEVEQPEELNTDKFTNELFENILFGHNNIIFTDFVGINTPTRYFVDIEKVIAIDSRHGKIERIAFAAELKDSYQDDLGGIVDRIKYGYVYADKERYQFWDREISVDVPIVDVTHDLGECPALYISLENFPYQNEYLYNAYRHTDIVKKGIFSYTRELLEEYNFLSTLLKMTEPNGAIPVAVKLQTNEKTKGGQDIAGVSDKEPSADNIMGAQKSAVRSTVTPSNSVLQAGTVIDVPIIEDAEGKVNMDLVTNFLTFFYTPVESLKYINTRISEIEGKIIASVLGDYTEANEAAKNELQVGKSYVSKEDKLRELSRNLSVVATESDRQFLESKYGKGTVQNSKFFGSDFFLETQDDLFKRITISPNPIEDRNVLIRLSKNRNLHNNVKARREKILYSLLPYATTASFNTAIAQGIVPYEVIAYQTMFNYWVDMFEAEYGDIVTFWDSMGSKDSQKIILINNLINQIINESDAIKEPGPVGTPARV